MKRGILALALVLAIGAGAARAAHVITFSPGGVMWDFIQEFQKLREARTPVVVDGLCLSACTIMLGILNNEQVCVTNRAIFGFHSARFVTGDYAEEATRMLWEMYPDQVRALLRERGWNGPSEHPDFLFIRAKDLGVYRTCGWFETR